MKVNEYVRTKYGISQYKYYKVIGSDDVLGVPVKDGSRGIFANKEDIIKSSPNIIDLIEVGDYVNGYLVIERDINNELRYIDLKDRNIMKYVKNLDIKSIVTKEQFSNCEYKIGE